jgi:preprotein translocase subunit YajC
MLLGISRGVTYLLSSLATLLLAVAQVVAQQTPPAAAPTQQPPAPPSLFGALMDMLPMLAICYLIFYFMVIRPQDRKSKQHKALLDSMKKGDSVVTSSGMIGTVAAVNTDNILLELAPNVKVKFLRGHIVRFEVEPKSAA